MEKPFDDLHVGIESQLLNSPEHIPDSAAVSAARKDGDTVDGLIELGKALSWQLRYRQAILAYTQALKMDPDNRTVLRLRAGRYLTTLQSDLAIRDFEQCLAFGGDKLDCGYRMGLAHYYAGRYSQAAQTFESCISLCGHCGNLLAYTQRLQSRRRTESAVSVQHRDESGASYGL